MPTYPNYDDPSKRNLTGPSNLVKGPSNLVGGPPTPRTDFGSALAPSSALASALTPRGPLAPSPWSQLKPQLASQVAPTGQVYAGARQTIQEMGAGGQNHEMAWSSGVRVPQANQAPFDVPNYFGSLDAAYRQPNKPRDFSGGDLYAWGSGIH